MIKPTRILHLRASNFVGGPERQILRYAEYENGGDVEIMVGSFVGEREGKDLLEQAASRGVRTFAIKQSSVRGMAQDLVDLIRRENIALICTHGYKATVVAYLAKRKQPVGLAAFLRGWTGEDKKVRFFEAVERRLLSRMDRVVCLSQNQVERLGGGTSWQERARVVVNVATPDTSSAARRAEARAAIQQRHGVPAGALIIASAGRLSPEKGTRFLLKASAEILKQHSNAHLVIFGDGPLAGELKAAAGAISERIHFAGFTPDFPQLLAGIDLMVNPSLAEEMPNVILEAMASGVPVVATAVGGVPEIAGKPAVFPLVPAGDAAALSLAISNTIASPEKMSEIASAQVERLKQSLSPARQRQQLRNLYRELAPWVSFADERPVNTGLPKISIVMPVRNEEHTIGAGIRALLEQDYPRERMEILVADGNSTDGTRAVVEEMSRQAEVVIRALPNPGQLSSAGRNVGARAATGDIVAFIDGHCHIPGRGLLSNIAETFQETKADALCRPQPLDFPGNNEFQQMVAAVRGSTLGHGLDSTIYSLTNAGLVDPTSSGAIYRREVFDKVGYYDESFDACEDVEFNHRVNQAGLEAYIHPGLTIFYQPRGSFSALFKQLKRYGWGRYRLMRKHPSAFSLAQLIPPAFLIYLVVAMFGVALLPSVWKIVIVVPLAVYAALVLAFSLTLVPRSGWKVLFYGPALYFTVHSALGWGFLCGAGEHIAGGWPGAKKAA